MTIRILGIINPIHIRVDLSTRHLADESTFPVPQRRRIEALFPSYRSRRPQAMTFDPLTYAGNKTGVTTASKPIVDRARALVCMLREDARAPYVPEDRAPLAAADADACSKLQVEVLYAAKGLLALCHQDPSRGPRKHVVGVANALLEHPLAVDQLLCFLVCCPHIGAGPAPWSGEDCAGAMDYFDSAKESAEAAATCAPSPAQAGGAYRVAMVKGPVGLLHELLAHANSPLLGVVAESPWWPRAAAVFARFVADAGAPEKLPALLASLAASMLAKLARLHPPAAPAVRAAIRGDVGASAALAAAAGAPDADDAARRALKATCVRLLELFAEGEEPPHDRRCLACGAETTSRCARCKVVFFCNNDRKCLAAVWAEHKGHCVAAKTP